MTSSRAYPAYGIPALAWVLLVFLSTLSAAQHDLIFADSFESGSTLAWGGGSFTNKSDLRIKIVMSSETVGSLNSGGFYLYSFKAVQSTDQAGRPLIWFRTQNYSLNTTIEWSNRYSAYTSFSRIEQNNQIVIGADIPITPGQTWVIDSNAGTGKVITAGPATAVSIHNTTTQQFTTGLLQPQTNDSKPLCAFPLFGGFVDVITPIDKVLLIFSTELLEPGTVIESLFNLTSELSRGYMWLSTSPGILIDLTDADLREVGFDINEGWSWGGFSWARGVSATENLVPLLIEGPAPFASIL